MTLSLLSTCSWCVVRAYTWLALWLSLSFPPVAGVWWAHTLDWLYDSLSSPPVAGVWWVHTLDCLYDSLSSPPVAGVRWAHTLDWLYVSLSSPPVAGVWWAHWRRCPVAAVASSKWKLHTGGGWGETPPPPPHMIVKRFGCTAIHIKALYKKCIIYHSYVTFVNSVEKHTVSVFFNVPVWLNAFKVK